MRGIVAVFGLTKLITVFLSTVCFSASVWAAEDPIKLTFGLYANENPIVIVSKFRPILDEIENQFLLRYKKNVSIKVDIARTYQQGINHLVSGRFDFARFGAASYIIAKSRRNGIDAIAVENYKGKNHFNGLIFVHDNSPINNIVDLKNKSFAFGGLNSTIGRYLAQQLLYQHGIYSKDLSHFDYLGRHDDVFLAVATGAYDAGAVKESTYKRLKKQDYELRVIQKIKVPTKPWITSATINAEVKRQLQVILLEYQNSTSLKKLGKYGFLQPDAQTYANIELAINDNLLFFSNDLR